MASAVINVMTGAARKASRILLRDFGEAENLRHSIKGAGKFVSVADLRVEEILITELSKARPDFDILSEEAGFIASTTDWPGKIKQKWIIDPIDGTRNFIHGFPFFTISLAVQTDDDITAGVIYAPLTDELFFAEKGGGAFLNQKRVRVSNCDGTQKALLAFGHMGAYSQKIAPIMRKGGHIRRLGCVSLELAYVACARLDGFLSGNVQIWDIAAGVLLVKEAGGSVSTIMGGDITLDKQLESLIACPLSLKKDIIASYAQTESP